MNKMQDLLGTPCHIASCRRKSRDDIDAYVPMAPDITATREKGYGATFSHGNKIVPSKRTLKRIASDMIDCPNQKNRAGLYDTITIQDDDGNEYQQILDFDANSIGEVYNKFRGKYLGEKIYFRGYYYTLIKIEKAGYQKRKSKSKNKDNKKNDTPVSRERPHKNICILYGSTIISGKRVNIITGKHYSCCGKRLSHELMNVSYQKKLGKIANVKLSIGQCKVCGKYYINRNVYDTYKCYNNLSINWKQNKFEHTLIQYKKEEKSTEKCLYFLDEKFMDKLRATRVLLLPDNDFSKQKEQYKNRCYKLHIVNFGFVNFLYMKVYGYFYASQLEIAKLITYIGMDKINEWKLSFYLDGKKVLGVKYHSDEMVNWELKRKKRSD